MAVTIIMRMVLMSEVFILQWSGEMKSTSVVVVCLFILFLCSSWCGVAAATLLAKDEPIKKEFPNRTNMHFVTDLMTYRSTAYQ